MKKWFLFLFVLLLAACNTDPVQKETPSDSETVSVENANTIAQDVINSIWDTLSTKGLSEANEELLKENEAAFLPFMTEDMFLHVLDSVEACTINCMPAVPKQIYYALNTQLIENSAESFTIEHTLPATFDDEQATKQTTTFIKQDDRYIISDLKNENTTVTLTKEQA